MRHSSHVRADNNNAALFSYDHNGTIRGCVCRDMEEKYALRVAGSTAISPWKQDCSLSREREREKRKRESRNVRNEKSKKRTRIAKTTKNLVLKMGLVPHNPTVVSKDTVQST